MSSSVLKQAEPTHVIVLRTLVASFALFVYDYTLTFEREVKYVWSAGWTPGKVLFLLTRYPGFVDMPIYFYVNFTGDPVSTTCWVALKWTFWSFLIAALSADAVIGLRTWAIWSRSPICACLIAAAYVTLTISTIYYTNTYLTNMNYDPVPLPAGCPFVDIPLTYDSISRVYLVFAVYESLIFTATVISGIQRFHGKKGALTAVLYRDAFVANFVLFAAALINVLAWSRETYWANACSVFLRVCESIVTSRIILNIREAALTVDGWDVTLPTETNASFSFAATNIDRQRGSAVFPMQVLGNASGGSVEP